VDGWSVRLAQGAAAFQAWTSRPAPVDAMRAALEA
jgi:shikimate 5-dehydrogenase